MMGRIGRHRPSASLVLAAVAVVLAMGGTAAAASLITSKQIKNGTIQLVDISKNARAKLRGARGPAGQPGEQGAKGDKGDKGDAGASATKLWAVVNSAGTLRRQSGATGVTRPGTGDYIVTFNQPVNGCAYSVTLLRLVPNDIAVAAGLDDGATASVTTNTQVEVMTGDNTGSNVNANFALSVFC